MIQIDTALILFAIGGLGYFITIFMTYKYLKMSGYNPPDLITPPRFAFLKYCSEQHKSTGDNKLRRLYYLINLFAAFCVFVILLAAI